MKCGFLGYFVHGYEVHAHKRLNGFKLQGCEKPEVMKVCAFDRCEGYCSMNQRGELLHSPGWDASALQVYPSIRLSSTHLYAWVERGIMDRKYCGI